MADIECWDDDVVHERCGVCMPHEDHYWRTDGKRFRYLDGHPAVRYCSGKGTNEEYWPTIR